MPPFEFRYSLSGDYVFPRFAPDGRRLAFAQVVTRDSGESTRLLVLDLTSNVVDTLMDPDSARALGVYSSFVIGIDWQSSELVSFLLSDGDVGSTRLQFSVARGRLVQSESSEGEDDERPLPDSLRPLADQLIAHHSTYPRAAIEGALWNHPVILGDSAVLVQFSYHGVDNSVHLLDIRSATETVLVRLPSGPAGIAAFGGGISVRGAVAFVVREDSTAVIYSLARSGRLTQALAVAAHMQQPYLERRFANASSAIAILKTTFSYERSQNLAFVLDSAGVRLLPLPDSLFDIDVTSDARLLAAVYWIGHERHLGLLPLASSP
jgi:hypothetical protein